MKRHYGRDALGFPVQVSQRKQGAPVHITQTTGVNDQLVILDAKALRFVVPFLLSAMATGSITPPKRKTKAKT